MEPRARKLVNRVSVVAAVTSFVLQPIPALDELAVVPMHYWLVVRLARLRGVPVASLPWTSLQRIVWYGAGARLVANFSLGLVPVAGAFSNAVTAMVLTEFLGRWLDDVLEHPDAPPPEVTMSSLRKMFADAIEKRRAKAA
jgi:uncharacterized protein (DUF697 family)